MCGESIRVYFKMVEQTWIEREFPPNEAIPDNCDICDVVIQGSGHVSANGVFAVPHARCDKCCGDIESPIILILI